MSVYVDDMEAPFGRMKMCHMIADTDKELHAMADRICVQQRWFQKPGTPGRHYDIAMSKRALALEAGAVPITMKERSCMVARRRIEGDLGSPAGARAWCAARLAEKFPAPAAA